MDSKEGLCDFVGGDVSPGELWGYKRSFQASSYSLCPQFSEQMSALSYCPSAMLACLGLLPSMMIMNQPSKTVRKPPINDLSFALVMLYLHIPTLRTHHHYKCHGISPSPPSPPSPSSPSSPSQHHHNHSTIIHRHHYNRHGISPSPPPPSSPLSPVQHHHNHSTITTLHSHHHI